MLNQTLSKQGKISVWRPQRLRIEYTSTPQKFYISDGKKLWVYIQDDTVAYEFAKPKEVISREAWSFLSGLEGLTDLFTIDKSRDRQTNHLQIKSPHLKTISLVPKRDDAVVRELTLGVDAKTLIVKEAIMVNASGNETHYEFRDFYFDQPLQGDAFTLPKDPKRKIIRQ